MVLLSAAVLTKSGKTLVSRQFVEMTKSRIEGLLAAFPKLVPTGKQHTFVETDTVRYVYQPIDKLYMLLVTTKASNILEDLETLRLFVKVIQEYCRTMEEADICDNAFNLIFAFDEIVALGYRESVYLAQIRTYVEMDSQEEKAYLALRKSQERDAKNKMREKAKELQRQRLEASKQRAGKSSATYSETGFGSASFYKGSSVAVTAPSVETRAEPSAPSRTEERRALPKAMKLGARTRNVDSFIDQLMSEGETIRSVAPPPSNGVAPEPDEDSGDN